MCRLKPLPKSLVSKEDIKYFLLSSLQLQWLNELPDWVEILETLLLHPDSAYQLKINMGDFYVTLCSEYMSTMACNNKLDPIDFKLKLVKNTMLMPLDTWVNYQFLRIFAVNDGI